MELKTEISQPISKTKWARLGKRIFDFLATIIILIIFAVPMGAIAILTRLSGPVFFRQERAGWNGRPFRTWKFRTMRAGRRPDPAELVPLDHADITPFGRFLRRTKLDEMPQLFNVLAGEMSLVGPRPTLPDQVAAYDDFRRRRLLVRPGMTGLAQVNSSAQVSWEERILYDVAYVRLCSFRLDMAILLRTLLVILMGEERMTRPFASSPYAGVVTPPTDYWNESVAADGTSESRKKGRRAGDRGSAGS
jgi:undecaprenyl phosphate N,N'-diacetylbacillosamine 1-phosphate transferase